jgi:hypothetical protein
MRGPRWPILIWAGILLFSSMDAAAGPGRECHAEGDALVCGYRCLRSTAGRWSCADTPDGSCQIGDDGQATCTRKAPAVRPPGGHPPKSAQCLKSQDGHVSCGYRCFENLAGHAICAQTPDGMCLMESGRVLCSEVDAAPWTIVNSERAECSKDATGQVACGYGCRQSVDGHGRCAQTPDGACAADDFGRVVCTEFKVESRLVELSEIPPPTCTNEDGGQPVCGYQCLKASDGSTRCATTSDGACALDSAGHVVCSDFASATRLTRSPPPAAPASPSEKERLSQGVPNEAKHP